MKDSKTEPTARYRLSLHGITDDKGNCGDYRNGTPHAAIIYDGGPLSTGPDYYGLAAIVPLPGKDMGEGHTYMQDAAERDDLAALIVRAVNSYDALTAALAAVADWAQDAGPLAGKTPGDVGEHCRKALAKVQP
jgi:hypothetical protein